MDEEEGGARYAGLGVGGLRVLGVVGAEELLFLRDEGELVAGAEDAADARFVRDDLALDGAREEYLCVRAWTWRDQSRVFEEKGDGRTTSVMPEEMTTPKPAVIERNSFFFWYYYSFFPPLRDLKGHVPLANLSHVWKEESAWVQEPTIGGFTYKDSFMCWWGRTPSMAKIQRGTAKRRRKTTRIVWRGNAIRGTGRTPREATYIEFVEFGEPNDSVPIDALLALRSAISRMKIESQNAAD